MRAALIALLLAASASCILAQDASECEAPLAQLRGQLSDIKSQLAAAEASGSSCTTEAAELKDKLAAAEAALKTAPDAAALQEERERLQAEAKAAQDSLGAAMKKLEGTEAELATAQQMLTQVNEELKAQKDQVQGLQRGSEEARNAITTCDSKRAELEQAAAEAQARVQGTSAEVAAAREEVAKYRAEAAAAKAQLLALESAWLPAWAAASVAPALAQTQEMVKQYTAQGSQAAAQAWESHGRPALHRSLTFAQEKASQLNSAIESKAGDSWPKFKGAVASAAAAAAKHGAAAAAATRKHALAVWNSRAVASVRPALVAAGGRAAAQGKLVQVELEEVLIRVLAKNNNSAPLARRPYVTYMVYAALLVPLVAFGMPLLGLRRSGSQSAGGARGSAPMSTKKKKKPAGRAH